MANYADPMRRWLGSAAPLALGLVAFIWLWFLPTQVSYPVTPLKDGGVVHSRSCGVPVVHAWTGYTLPGGTHLGWLYEGPHADFEECIEQAIGHTMVGVVALLVAVVASVLLRPRQWRTEHESAMSWRAMEPGS